MAKSMAKDMKEIGNKPREFYEFVLPPVDMHMDKAKLTVIVDIPGFDKEEISLTVTGNILSINAEKTKEEKSKEEIICSQRPNIIDKKIRLPIYVRENEDEISCAEYSDGVLTLTFPVTEKGKDVTIE